MDTHAGKHVSYFHFITVRKFQKDPCVIFDFISFKASVRQSSFPLNNHFRFAIRFFIKEATLTPQARIKVTRSHMHTIFFVLQDNK